MRYHIILLVDKSANAALKSFLLHPVLILRRFRRKLIGGREGGRGADGGRERYGR